MDNNQTSISSTQQFREELDRLYQRLTDPEEREKEILKERKEVEKKEIIEDLGL